MVKLSKEDFKKKIENLFPEEEIEILEYSAAFKTMTYKCKKCGREYTVDRANRLYDKKYLCYQCHLDETSYIRQEIKNVVEMNGFKVLEKVNNVRKVIKIKCNKCGRIIQIHPQNTVVNKKITCPRCEDALGNHVTKEDFIYRMGERAKDYKILEFKDMSHTITFQHKCGFVFKQFPGNFLKGRGCPKCFGKVSKGEQFITKWLEKNNINFEFQKKFPELKLKSYDFFIPEQNILIEYQGEQHYKPLKCFGGEEKFAIQQERDKIKRDFAKTHGYTLIEIPYNEEIEPYLIPLKRFND